MRYLRTDVRIYKGTNSRGDYHWMSQRLFNDKNPQANPTRLPIHFTLLPTIVNAFLEHKDALKENEGGWLDVDLSKIPDEGLTVHHLDDVNKETVALDTWYQQVYVRDTTGADGKVHTAGSLRVGSNGLPLPPVNSLTVMVQYFEDETFVDGMKVKRWMPVETAEEIKNFIVARSYRRLTEGSIAAPTFAGAEEDNDNDAPKSAEDKDAERAELERRLAELK